MTYGERLFVLLERLLIKLMSHRFWGALMVYGFSHYHPQEMGQALMAYGILVGGKMGHAYINGKNKQ